MKELIISSAESGQRFDKFLGKYLPKAGRPFLYKMLRKKNITLNGKKAAGSEILAPGDKVKLFFSEETIDLFTGKMPINSYDIGFESLIIYEDEDIMLINKPAGMLSQKAAAGDVSLCEYLISYLYSSKKVSDESLRAFTPSVANRLDRNTSGLITAGKTLRGLQRLSETFRTRMADKYYLALVRGDVSRDYSLEGYLQKDEKTNTVHIKNEGDNSERIKTEVSPVCSNNGFSLVRIKLLTGKTHQIRAVLSSCGFPILGDKKYGVGFNGAGRQMLHSYQLVWNGTEYTAPLPADFERLAKKLGLI